MRYMTLLEVEVFRKKLRDAYWHDTTPLTTFGRILDNILVKYVYKS